jgi:two-component SAPR family response regulator
MKRDKVLKFVVDKMLEPYNSSYEQVIEEPKIDGVFWYQYYTWGEGQKEEFKNFFIKTLTKRCSPKYSIDGAKREWAMFDLAYGLRELR